MKKTEWKKLLLCLAIPLLSGGLGALLAGKAITAYRDFAKPPLSPPGWVFPVVWTLLYAAMGYASYRVLVSDAASEKIRSALRLYGLQLIVNILWPLLFFRMEAFLAAFFWLVLLWVLIYLTVRAFSKIDEWAGNILLPYLLWVTFAGYLNFGVFLLNS